MAKGDQTRQRIVEAAAAMFNQRGYEGSSLNELMQATGLKKGGIYRHFHSKEELAAEAFDYNWAQARRVRMQHLDPATTGVARLKQFIANFVEHRSPVPGGCPILNYAIDSDDGNPMLRARVTRALRSWIRRLESIVKDASKRGEIGDADPRTVATLMIATLEGALMISRLEQRDSALRRAQRHLNGYLETLERNPAPHDQGNTGARASLSRRPARRNARVDRHVSDR